MSLASRIVFGGSISRFGSICFTFHFFSLAEGKRESFIEVFFVILKFWLVCVFCRSRKVFVQVVGLSVSKYRGRMVAKNVRVAASPCLCCFWARCWAVVGLLLLEMLSSSKLLGV